MKAILTRFVATATVLATANFALAANGVPAPQPTTAQKILPTTPMPKLVAARTALSNSDLAKYAQSAVQSRATTTKTAAGASENKTLWIVLGVAAVAGIVALTSSGGYGGGGSGYSSSAATASDGSGMGAAVGPY